MRNLILTLVAALALTTPAFAQTRAVAVTFDDLPYQAPEEALCDPAQAMALTRDFLAMLKPLKTHAVAFVNEGKVCDAQRATLLPRIETAWLDAGLELGNHTFSHINIHRTTAEAWLADVDMGEIVTRPLLKRRGKTLRWFRHPFLFTGETPEKKAAMAQGLKARGYVVAPVTLDTYDWMFATIYRHAEAAGDKARMQEVGEAYLAHTKAMLDHFEPYSAEVAGGREPAQVLLLHANSLNRDWYPKVHATFLARGYRFVSLDEALKDPVYALPDPYVRANGVSWLHRWAQGQGRKIRWEADPPDWIVKAYEAKP
jgi:peptidoglycan/xylan/chitin deacetylase (PgdA/CDA1 family)